MMDVAFSLNQLFSTGVLQEFLKHAIPDYLVRGTYLVSVRLSNKNITTGNTTIAISVNKSKLQLFFCQIGNRYISGVLQNFSIISLCEPRDEKG